ncbi:MAG: PAS domain S-box protein [Cyclobacteriaceae bacterium]|nr:PAS domain S-box protein [Cyclobacteriaceae bacterium]
MFKRINIRGKLTTLILFLVVVTICTSGYISYSIRKNMLQEKYLQNLGALADVKKDKIQDFIHAAEGDINLISTLELFQNVNEEEVTMDEMAMFDEDTIEMAMDGFNTELLDLSEIEQTLKTIRKSIDAEKIIITDKNGNIIVNTGSDDATNIKQIIKATDDVFIDAAKEGITFGQVFKSGESHHIAIGAYIGDISSSRALCFIITSIDNIYEDLAQDMGLGESVEIIIAEKRDNIALFLNPIKFDENAALNRAITLGSNEAIAMQQAVAGNEGIGYSVDYRGIETLSVWSYIPVLNWGLEIKVDQKEISDQAFVVVKKFAFWGGLILLFSALISLLFAQYFISPLLSLKDSLISVSQGILPDKIDKKYDDEIGQMAETTDDLVQSLKRTATFAEKIGKGDLKADFKPSSKGDILGNALIDMRKSLVETEQRDTERNWIVTGVAEISEILRSHDTIDKLGDAVIAYITEKIDAIQGAFYVVNDDDPTDKFIEMKSAYAYHKKKYMQSSFRFAEGLVGQAAAEKDYILRTEIPGDYVTITSGILGDKRPTSILITPLITEEKVFGVVEFAGFHRFSESQIKFVQEISLILARTIFNIKVNERTRNLLEESQKMSNELQEQQEVLRQNAEEMAATQEELKRTNQRLEDQIEEVNRTQNRMQLLLENASEVISIYEKEGTIRYISPSVERILGYAQNDLIGINDKIHISPEGVANFEDMFQRVIENPFESVTIQYEYIKKDGDAIWLEATATNLLSDPAIQGIILNTRDITERRRAEREERMKSKMQALSENSPDLITRFTQEGEVFYINPMIENYTGHKPSDILNKRINEVEVEEVIKKEWIDILRQVEAENAKVAKEMDFPSILGDRVMQVNAIPEYDEENTLESVLVVSHDITERKQIELEIQSKNRKITESINYAKRIQGAILPNNAVIRQILPDSFILYKARDVVSGDFPWFINMGDIIYFAAVDCTGHGVPGALISLIGYFLLNDIVKGRKISDPGEILDQLDKSVTKTLRQDTDESQTKDGMDIALCKIDLKNNVVAYAGAHRPLYYMNDSELEEIKGNKFPIGGGIYKNQTKFTSTVLQVNKGDSIFFCSDGFPDQFGGPDNRKYGPKRLRDAIVANHKKSMAEIYQEIDKDWSEWKGKQKQTDDVLLIGVRF